MRRVRSLILVGCILAALPGAAALGADDSERVEDGRRLAALLWAGRSVVSNNQELINREQPPQEGLTPDVFVEQLFATYEDQNGEPPLGEELNDRQRRLIEAQLDTMIEVIADYQPVFNADGVGFKGFIPALFARLVNDRFSEKVGAEALVKATAPPELVRNRKSLPDEWESAVIEEKFESPGWPRGKPWFETVEGRDGPVFRMLIPEYYDESCLACHGRPAGEVDVTGFPKEGRKAGDLGGAISITLPK